MAELDQLTVSTKRFIEDTPALVDMVFQNDPLIAYARQNIQKAFTGGRQIGVNFVYDGLIGGPYLKGKEFNITEPQIEQQIQLTPKFFEVNISLTLEDVEVLNTGPNAAFRLIQSRTTAAYMTMGAHLALGVYLNGTRANFTANFNGLAEALNDNSTVSWDNNNYSTYGTITRGGAVGTVLNSAARDINGDIEYNTLEESYGDASFGALEPKLGVTTVLGYSFVKEKFQTQQRFQNTQDPKISFNGMQFNAATLMKSRYAPGSHLFGSSGTADPVAVTFMQQMSSGALNAYPSPVGGYPAAGAAWETLWWLNCKRPWMTFYVSSSPLFQFGFTGFKVGRGDTKISGQVLFAGNFYFAPRYHRQLYRITG